MAKPHPISVQKAKPLARARRDLYELLSSAYIQIPEKKILELNWEPAAELLRYPQKGSEEAFTQIQSGLNLVKSYGSREDRNAEEILTNLSKDWTRLFRGVVRDGILPPYESLYRPERFQKTPAQEINHLFSEMGIQVPEEWHQPSDYIGVELDFMRLLCEREEKETDAPRQVLKFEYSFVEEHLALWVPHFCKKMLREAQENYYRGIARLTAGLVAYDEIYVKAILSD